MFREGGIKSQMEEETKRGGEELTVGELRERNEQLKENYQEVINRREEIYKKAIEQDSKQEGNGRVVEKHNQVVVDGTLQILHLEGLDREELSDNEKKERVIAIISTLLHDVGKLDSPLPGHHERGVEHTQEILESLKGQEIEGVRIDEEITEACKKAVERHMNHPFLVEIINKGKEFPRPETRPDRVVFGADMLANVGAKNVGFRLNAENFVQQDIETAKDQGITQLEAAFLNVMQGVEDLEKKNYVTECVTESTNKLIRERIGEIRKIYQGLKETGEFKKIQGEEERVVNPREAIERFNEAIEGAGKFLGISESNIEYYKI